MLLLAALCDDLVDKTDNFLVHIMCLVDCFDHQILRYFICSGLDHDNLLSCGSDCQLKIRKLLLSQRRVDDELSVNQANLCGSTRTIKRDIGNTGCDRGTKHSRDLRITLRIHRHNHVYQSYIVSVILRKQRTHRTVDNTGCQNCMLACLTFSFIESSWNLAYCVHFFFIFNTQREEIDSFSWLLGCCCSRKHSCITIMHQSCTVSLLCNTTNIYSQCSSG